MVYDGNESVIHTVALPADEVVQIVEELRLANRATFLFTQDDCLFINEEVGGKDWISVGGKYDTNVQNGLPEREQILADVLAGAKKVIKLTVCADPENVEGDLLRAPQ